MEAYLNSPKFRRSAGRTTLAAARTSSPPERTTSNRTKPHSIPIRKAATLMDSAARMLETAITQRAARNP